MIFSCVFLLVVNASLGFALTRQSGRAMRSLIENMMLDVSNTAAALLDGDTLEALEAEDRDTPEYQNALKILTCFESNIELEYIYCIRDMGDGSFVFMIDPDPESPGQFGEHIPYTDALYQASLGVPSVDKEPYEDNWGRFYSAYSPVFSSARKVAGIVAVDFSAEWYEDQINRQIRTTLMFVGASLLIAVAVIVLIAARYRKHFGALFHEMNQVSDGIETLVREVSPGTEIASVEDDVAHSNDGFSELGAKVHALQNKLSEQIAIVRSQAYIDGLTRLGNRAAYEDHVRRLEEQIRQGTAAFSVILFDLNGLKEINDRHGHEKGDQVIVEAASVLRQAFDEGKLYRIGGDEFVVILEGANARTGAWLDEVFGEKSHVSLSKGYAVYDPQTDTEYRAVFNRADNEMYENKREYYLTHEDRRRKP